MKNITLLLALTITTLTFTSCGEDNCAFKFCDQPDIDYINSLSLVFDNNIPQNQIETAYLVRFNKDDGFFNPIDSVLYSEAANNTNTLVLADGYPFSSGGFINLNSYEDYDYIIRNATNDFAHKLSDIEVKGQYDECDCDYTNTQKTFELDNEVLDRTNSNVEVMLKVK